MELEQITPGPLAFGTQIKRRHLTGERTEGTMQVTAFEKGRVMAVAIHEGQLRIHSQTVVGSMFDGMGSMITISIDVPFSEDKVDPQMLEQSLNNIKSLIETEA